MQHSTWSCSHAPADVLSAELVRAAACNGTIRLRINDALDARTQLNCAHAMETGGRSVQIAMMRDANNIERDALELLLFANFFNGPHFRMTTRPNGG